MENTWATEGHKSCFGDSELRYRESKQRKRYHVDGWKYRSGGKESSQEMKKWENWGTWLAQSVDCATLDLGVVSLCPMLGVELT